MTGDGAARYQLAEWRAKARSSRAISPWRATFIALPARPGIIEGSDAYTAFLAAGAGGPRDWAQSPVILGELVPGIDLARRAAAVAGARDAADRHGRSRGGPERRDDRRVAEDRPLQRILSAAGECAWLAQAAEPMFEPAPTVDERTGRLIMNPVRTSDTAVFPWVAENPAVTPSTAASPQRSATRAEQGEPLQVLRYAPGQEYRPHIDAVPGLANQRILTMLVWLNDDYEGGETRFIETGLTVKGNKGDALLFENVDAEGRPIRRWSMRASPVTAGVKPLASRWIWRTPVTE